MDFKNWIKMNWKTVLLILFVLLWFTKCTQSCNRGAQLKNNDSMINQQEQVIDSLTRIIELNNKDIDWLKENKKDISSIANTNQNNYINEITKLREENSFLKNKIDMLSKKVVEQDAIIKNFTESIDKI